MKGARHMATNLHVDGVADEILSILEAQGLPVKRSLDVDVPPLPEDITEIDDSELMGYYNKYLQNYNFLLTQVACAELAVVEIDNAYDMVEAKAMLSKTTGKSTEKSVMLKALVITDPEIVDLSTKRLQAQAYHKLLKTVCDGLERSFQLTSRELSRRNSVYKARGF